MGNKLALFFLTIFLSPMVHAYDPREAIRLAINDEYGNRVSNIQMEQNDVLSIIGNSTMNLTNDQLKQIFDDHIRDYEVMLKVGFTLDGKRLICRSLVKSRTKNDPAVKVYTSSCGLSLVQIFTGSPADYKGPRFLKQIIFQNGAVKNIESLPPELY